MEPLLRLGNDGKMQRALAEDYGLARVEVVVMAVELRLKVAGDVLNALADHVETQIEGSEMNAPANDWAAVLSALPPMVTGELRKLTVFERELAIAPSDLFPDDLYPAQAEAFPRELRDSKQRALRLEAPAYGEPLAQAIETLENLYPVRVAVRPVYQFTLRRGARFHDMELPDGSVVLGRPVEKEDIRFSLELARTKPPEPLTRAGNEPGLVSSLLSLLGGRGKVGDPEHPSDRSELFADAFINPNVRSDALLISSAIAGNPKSDESDPARRRFEVTLKKWSARHPWMWGNLYIYPHDIYDLTAARPRLLGLGPTYGQSLLAAWPVGTGPYRMRRHDANEVVVLERVELPSDVGGQIPITFIEFRFMPDAFARQAQLVTGGFDLFLPPVQQADLLQGRPGWRRFEPIVPPSAVYYFLAFNMRRTLFNGDTGTDAWRVRRALAALIPYEEIIDKVFAGLGKRITGPFHPDAEWYDEGIEAIRYDEKAAFELLAEAGWVRSQGGSLRKGEEQLKVRLVTSAGREQAWVDTATVIQDRWEAAGIEVAVETLEWNAYITERIEPFDFDTCIIGIEASRFEARADFMWHSRNAKDSGGYNISNFGGADSLINEFEVTPDTNSRNKRGAEIHRRIADQCPYAFLLVRVNTAFVRSDIGVLGEGGFSAVEEFPYSGLVLGVSDWVRKAGEIK
jgi:ABC-type transport system substrate-binding protein